MKKLNGGGSTVIRRFLKNSNICLCDYSAREIYGQNYRAFSEGIGCQNFSKHLGSFDDIYELVKELYPNGEDNEILAKILDPEYPH